MVLTNIVNGETQIKPSIMNRLRLDTTPELTNYSVLPWILQSSIMNRLRLGRPTKIHGMHTLKVLTQENMQNTL
jgi:hypothetical protein